MASYFPINKKEMLRIHGLGEIKYEKYGHIFLSIVIDYCEKNNIKPAEKKIKPIKPVALTSKSRSFQTTGEKFNAGMSIDYLCSVTKYRKSTILQHLLKYLEEYTINEPSRLLDESTLSKNKIDLVLKKFEELGTEKLSPIFDSLNGKIDYNELHLLRIYFIAERLKRK
jgi:ATP-dependent DNA helicase RecQ